MDKLNAEIEFGIEFEFYVLLYSEEGPNIILIITHPCDLLFLIPYSPFHSPPPSQHPFNGQSFTSLPLTFYFTMNLPNHMIETHLKFCIVIPVLSARKKTFIFQINIS